MNPIEQVKQTRRTDELAESIHRLESATVEVVEELRILINQERTARLTLADEQRNYVDSADKNIARIGDERWAATWEAQVRIIALSEPLRRPFGGRLKWLMVGR